MHFTSFWLHDYHVYLLSEMIMRNKDHAYYSNRFLYSETLMILTIRLEVMINNQFERSSLVLKSSSLMALLHMVLLWIAKQIIFMFVLIVIAWSYWIFQREIQ